MISRIDTHAHLSMLKSRGMDPHETLKGLFDSGFSGIIDISLEPGDLAARIKEFSPYAKIRFASGLWPHAASIARRRELVPALERDLIQGDPSLITARPAGSAGSSTGLVCALGEFGLDHHWNGEDHEGGSPDLAGEQELMEAQLALAEKLRLPVIIHSREAPKETLEILAAFPGVRGVIHCYSYGPKEVRPFLDLGYFISFAGNITYKNAGNIREACVLVPQDRLLLETDCPFLAPVPHRGNPAHPGMVEECYRLTANLRGMDEAELAELAAANTASLFGVQF